jgi:hypothetical protein
LATPEIVDLLMSSGGFARLSASEQRFRLVRYFQPWFSPGWKPDTVNNIRATQRLVTHAKTMNSPVGTILLVRREEASGLGLSNYSAGRPADVEPSTRGLLDVEVNQADLVPALTPETTATGCEPAEPTEPAKLAEPDEPADLAEPVTRKSRSRSKPRSAN